jgi:hypothetical protein
MTEEEEESLLSFAVVCPHSFQEIGPYPLLLLLLLLVRFQLLYSQLFSKVGYCIVHRGIDFRTLQISSFVVQCPSNSLRTDVDRSPGSSETEP